jgi:hypothetical protein
MIFDLILIGCTVLAILVLRHQLADFIMELNWGTDDD